jgi:pimeloyl-ACP methyl ester carboxylesterase
MVSLEAARIMPERVLGVIGVDTLHDAELQFNQEQVQEVVARFKTDFRGTMTSFIKPMFSEQTDPELADWVISKACSANQEVVLAISLDMSSLDIKQSFLSAKVPIRCINAAPYPPMNTETKVETNRKYADFDVVVMENVGHFLMLERPAEFNMHLRQILSQMITP